jgi:hypothetical protein
MRMYTSCINITILVGMLLPAARCGISPLKAILESGAVVVPLQTVCMDKDEPVCTLCC